MYTTVSHLLCRRELGNRVRELAGRRQELGNREEAGGRQGAWEGKGGNTYLLCDIIAK